MTSGDYAAKARALKVLRLVAAAPMGESAEENDQIAQFFEHMTLADRLAFADLADVNPPSDVTWEVFVQVLRDRAVPMAPRKPMGRVEAMRLGVEAALGGTNALNGGAHPEDEDEPETVIDASPLTSAEAIADLARRGPRT